MRNDLLPPASLITRREAAQLSGTALNAVNKAIEQRVVPAQRRKRRTLLAPEEVGPLALLQQVQLSLPVALKRRVVAWARTCPGSNAELALSGALLVRMSPEIDEATRRATRYVELRERLVEVNPHVQGGEPVIKGTRMPIRSLARLIELGETAEVLREDYPFLPDEAFELAPMWAKANPRRGRPRRPWNVQDRSPARRSSIESPSS